MDLAEQIEIVARDLPENYMIYLGIEKGAAWVELRKGCFESETIDFDTTDMNLDEQIDEALKIAIVHNKRKEVDCIDGTDRGLVA